LSNKRGRAAPKGGPRVNPGRVYSRVLRCPGGPGPDGRSARPVTRGTARCRGRAAQPIGGAPARPVPPSRRVLSCAAARPARRRPWRPPRTSCRCGHGAVTAAPPAEYSAFSRDAAPPSSREIGAPAACGAARAVRVRGHGAATRAGAPRRRAAPARRPPHVAEVRSCRAARPGTRRAVGWRPRRVITVMTAVVVAAAVICRRRRPRLRLGARRARCVSRLRPV
jgi:hypothetical protein